MSIPTSPPAHRRSHPWLAGAVSGLDRRLRRLGGVTEYSDHPDCIFRIARSRLERRLVLGDGVVIAKDAAILELHLWNERVPLFPEGGAKLAWARRMATCLDASLDELARHLAQEPALADIAAIRANMTFSTAERSAQVLRICGRFGFVPVRNPRAPSPGQRLHHLGENILIGLLILGRNPGAFRLDSLRRNRTEVVLTRESLEGRRDAGAGGERW